jgi:sugar (pentulose or hexulose) kinase
MKTSGAGAVVVAIDSSTTACKALAVRADGTVVSTGQHPHQLNSPHPGWREQDAEQWWVAAVAAIRAAVDALPAGATVRALGVTHQRETFVCLDAELRPLRPAILWLDTRAGAQVQRLGSAPVHRRSGKPPSTTPSFYKLAWLAEYEPETLRRGARVLDVHGYLGRRLTGADRTSWASADPTGLLDMAAFDWDATLLATAGVRRDQMPDLVPPGSVLGELSGEAARLTGLPAATPVVAGAGDGQCAGLGCGVVEETTGYLNLGTGLTSGRQSAQLRVDRAFRTLASPLAGAYTLEALIAAGMHSARWWIDTAFGGDLGAATAAAEAEPDSGRLLFLPYLTSAESPYWDPAARGCFIGLDDTATAGRMYRAVLEGLAFEQRLVLEGLLGGHGDAEVNRLVCTGGGTGSRLLMRTMADVLGRPLEVVAGAEASALGAAVLAAAAVGLDGLRDVPDAAAAMVHIADTVAPSSDPRARPDDKYAAYRELYPALRDTFARLAGADSPPRHPAP